MNVQADDWTTERSDRTQLPNVAGEPAASDAVSRLGGAAFVAVDRRLIVVSDEGGLAGSRFSRPTRVGLSLADAFGIEDFDELEAACRAALAGEEVVLSCASDARSERYLVRVGPRADGDGAVSLWMDMGEVGERSRAERARGDELQQLWLACRMLARVEGREAVREAICTAALEVASCSSAALLEPVDGGRELELTAAVGFESSAIGLPLDELSGATLALRTGGQQATMAGDAQPPGARRLIEACASESMLWQPISRGRVVEAIVCAGYRSGDRQPGARERRVLEALAVEGAMALGRDPGGQERERAAAVELSGGVGGAERPGSAEPLPDRAAFEISLERELHRAKRGSERLSVAIIGLDPPPDGANGPSRGGTDDFEALAEAWRPQLRGCDLLARHSSAQLSLLLCDCDPEDGARSLERMRQAGAPCFHAGLAGSAGSDSSERLLERAQGALERARQAGPGSVYH